VFFKDVNQNLVEECFLTPPDATISPDITVHGEEGPNFLLL
jgi:hypothetical protein